MRYEPFSNTDFATLRPADHVCTRPLLPSPPSVTKCINLPLAPLPNAKYAPSRLHFLHFLPGVAVDRQAVAQSVGLRRVPEGTVRCQRI
jgi:hypothetical protein